jgi:hypothetical protein
VTILLWNIRICYGVPKVCAESRYDDEYYSHLDQQTIGDEHPSGVLSEKQLELTTPAKCQQMYRDLVSLYMKIDNMMTVSGTHDNDVFSFTAAALKQRGLSSLYTEKAVYYFFKECQFYPTISRCTATSLPNNVSCSNDIININDDEEGIVAVPSMASYSAKSKRKGVDDDLYMNTICTNLGTMTKEYCSQNRRKEKESAMKEICIERESEKNEICIQRAAVMNEINITRNMISTKMMHIKKDIEGKERLQRKLMQIAEAAQKHEVEASYFEQYNTVKKKTIDLEQEYKKLEAEFEKFDREHSSYVDDLKRKLSANEANQSETRPSKQPKIATNSAASSVLVARRSDTPSSDATWCTAPDQFNMARDVNVAGIPGVANVAVLGKDAEELAKKDTPNDANDEDLDISVDLFTVHHI